MLTCEKFTMAPRNGGWYLQAYLRGTSGSGRIMTLDITSFNAALGDFERHIAKRITYTFPDGFAVHPDISNDGDCHCIMRMLAIAHHLDNEGVPHAKPVITALMEGGLCVGAVLMLGNLAASAHMIPN